MPLDSRMKTSLDKNVSLALNVRFREKQILDHILGPGIYDRRIRPAGVYNETGNKSFFPHTNFLLQVTRKFRNEAQEFNPAATTCVAEGIGALVFQEFIELFSGLFSVLSIQRKSTASTR